MIAQVLIAGMLSAPGQPVLSVCEATRKAMDGRGISRVEGELRHSVEIAAYLSDPTCPDSLIVLDLGTADRSYVDRPGDKHWNRGLRVILEGQLVSRPAKYSVGHLYRAKFVRITRRATDGA